MAFKLNLQPGRIPSNGHEKKQFTCILSIGSMMWTRPSATDPGRSQQFTTNQLKTKGHKKKRRLPI